ncbi:MAG: hypothetical protein LIO67_00005, partial [Lachnospiraceae bacterium]|nr:hypothetical protein [Lachnospiraceae bacterium]
EILVICVGALWGLSNVDMIWPSVLALVFLGFSSYSESVAAVFTSVFSNSTIQLILWLLIISATLTLTGISEQIANRLVNWKLTKGRPWVLSICIILASYICSMFASAFAGILICWNFVYTLCSDFNIKKNSKWPNMMLVGIVFAGTIGGAIMPFKQGTIATFGYLSAASDGLYSTFSYMHYAIWALIFGAVIMIFYFVACRFLVRPDMEAFKDVSSMGKPTPLDTRQKVALGGLGALIVFLFLPSCIPGTAVANFLDAIGTNAIILIIVCAIIFLRDRDGKPYFTFKELADKGVMWQMLFMVGAAMTLGTALASDATGIRTLFSNLLLPIFEGQSPFFFACIFAVGALIITNFINNAVVGAVMIPVMYTLSAEININPLALTALIAITSNVGLILPCACPLGALLHGNKEWVSSRAIFVQSCVAILATALATILVGVPLAMVLIQ